ncbi:dihydropteroate synthase [Pontibacillus marinus]|uniref:Dihydropteroate synthase n=1 Tax=Pontibacillus marinus BH030004 = DSM 16465 TaxID=1385511 RepID=A0A0A5FYB2_9BACI|nr:dihydropteroate synthase [Pontibacillus marinus]KGX83795.1 dihydropteroate synthase [Pontibacillus marinus BH030004 = DSM 16465]
MEHYLQTSVKSYDLQKQTLVMGILNVTPDSFSDGGQFNELEAAIEQAKEMEANGAHIIDVGGESTRPGHEPVSAEDELKRVLPIIRKLKQAVNIPISIDTYKAEVAQQAIEAGASIINDVWGAKYDPEMANVAAAYQVPIILMHNRDNREYKDLLQDMKEDLKESVRIVKEAGVKDHNIFLDPGVGFAKSMKDNLFVMQHLDAFNELGYPILLGTSRKRFIGHVLDLPVEERMEGTGATVCLGVQKGADIVRVHDVQPIARMVKMMDAMIGKGDAING